MSSDTRDVVATIGLAAGDFSARRLWMLLWRGMRRRCPNCGAGDAFESWFRLRPRCRACGLRLDRGENDFFLGAFTLNFVTAELALCAFMLAVIVALWPDVPWDFVLYGGAILMVIMPLVFFPFSRTIWLAIDLAFRPATGREFRGAEEDRQAG